MIATMKIAALALGLAALAACNTVGGLGEDVSAGGKAITNAAEKTEQAITK